MKNRAMICRALSGHAWEVEGPIVVLKGTDRRITFHCARCEGWRSDVWTAGGRTIKTRYYKHSKEYAEFISGHNRAEAREALVGTLKEKASEANDTGMRLVQGAGTTGKRRKPAKSVKRPRDKKRIAS